MAGNAKKSQTGSIEMRKLGFAAALLVWLLIPLQGNALGLGDITLKSGLNEPLKAEIALHSIREGELEELRVSLAPKRAFVRAGIDRPVWMTRFKFEVKQKATGTPYILVTSREPVREPFLNFLAEANWANGRVLRQYTLLVDPPVLMAEQESPDIESPAPLPDSVPEQIETLPAQELTQEQPSAQPLQPAEPLPDPEVIENQLNNQGATEAETIDAIASSPDPVPEAQSTEAFIPSPEEISAAEPPSASIVTPEPQEPMAAEPVDIDQGLTSLPEPTEQFSEQSDSVKVNRGDTLWAIAERNKRNSSVSTQQMLVAFFKANPSAFFDNNMNNLTAGVVLKIPDQASSRGISRAEAIEFINKHNNLWQGYRQQIANASNKPTLNQADTSTTVTDEGGASGSASSGSASSGADKLLELLTPKNDETAKASRPGTGGDIKELRNELTSANEQLTASKKENEELADRINELSKQVDKFKSLMKLKDNQIALLEDQAKKENIEIKDTPPPPKPMNQAAANPTSSDTPIVANPKSKAPVVQEEEEGGLLDGILATLDNPIVLGGAVGGVLIIGLIGYMMFRRRSMNLDEFQESILTAGGEGFSPTIAAGGMNSGQSSLLSDFSSSGLGVGIQSEVDVMDPLAEADVYLAYGRFQHAEELMKDALAKNPGQQEYSVKLLEIYAAMKDKSGFIEVATELQGSTGGQGPLWEKAVAMGRGLCPEHSMFGGSGDSTLEEDPTAPTDQILDGFDSNVDETVILNPGGEAMAAGDMDSSLNLGGGMDETFDLDSSSLNAMEDTMQMSMGDTSHATEDTMDMSMSMGEEGGLDMGDVGTDDLMSGMSMDDSMDMNMDLDADSSGGDDNVIDFDFESSSRKDESLDETLIAQPGELNMDMGGDDSLMASLDGGSEDDNLLQFQDSGSDDSGLGDFDFDATLDLGSSNDGADTSVDSMFDESGDGGDDLWPGDVDEVGTKMDLAKAYIDMGDPDGAKSILVEVMEEGNSHQKQEANELLSNLG